MKSRSSRIATLVFTSSLLLVASAGTTFAATPKATPKATAKATPKASPKASLGSKLNLPKTTPAPGVDRGGGRFGNLTTTQRACLVKQGVKLPSPSASGVRPTFSPNPSGSPRAFGGNRQLFNSPATIAAFKKCGITLPAAGGGFDFNSPKFVAFQKCMTAAGIKPTGGFGRYDQSDPDTAVALIKCQKSSGFTLPKRN